MPTLDQLQTDTNTLTTNVQTLLTNVNSQKTALATSVTNASGSATNATTLGAAQVTNATNSANAATTDGAAQVAIAAANVSTQTNLAIAQVTLATSNKVAQTNLSIAQVTLATASAVLATTNGAAQVTLATNSATAATTNGAAQVTIATNNKLAQTALSAAQVPIATSNKVAQTNLSIAQVTLATAQATLATSNGAAQVTLATASAILATTNGAVQVTLATNNKLAQTALSAAQVTIATTAANSATTDGAAQVAAATASVATYTALAVAQVTIATTAATAATTDGAAQVTIATNNKLAQTALSAAQVALATTSATNTAAQLTLATTSATNTATQATLAIAQTTAATNSANAANTSQTNTATQTTNATNSAAASLASENTSAAQAVIATTQAGLATTSNSNTAAPLASATASALAATYPQTTAAANATAATNLATAASALGLLASLATSISSTASASAVTAGNIQQDLSAANNYPLHRSPNAIVATFIYDVSKDSDGGAWVDRMQDKSWFNETLNGAWLPATSPQGWNSELDARSYKATLGAELNADPYFSTTTGWSLQAGFSISNGKLVLTAPGSGNAAFRTDPGTLLISTPYQFTLTIDSLTNGSIRINVGGIIYVANSPGTFVITACPLATSTSFLIQTLGSPTAVISYFSIKAVSAFTTTSGNIFQLSTDGKFYRLWKNLIANTSFAGAVNGTFGSGGVIGTGWGVAGIQTGVSLAISGSGVENNMGYVEFTFSGTPTLSGYTSIQSSSFTVLTAPSLTASSLYRVISGTNSAFLFSAAGTAGWGSGTPATSIVTVGGTNYTLQQRTAATTSSTTHYPYFLSVQFVTGTACSLVIRLYQPQLEYNASATTFEDKSAYTVATPISETFRGNTQKFPRLSAIVAEASNVTIYDLTQPDRPMWMRFLAPLAVDPKNIINNNVGGGLLSVAMLNGQMVVGAFISGASIVSFPKDNGIIAFNIANLSYKGNIAQRNNTNGIIVVGSLPAIVNNTVNAVAMIVLSDAPLDPFTGLQIPTIVVGTAGGVSVIKSDRTVVNSASGIAFTKVFADKDGIVAATNGIYTTANTKTPNLAASWGFPYTYPVTGTINNASMLGLVSNVVSSGYLKTKIGSSVGSGAVGVTLFRENLFLPGLGLVAYISSNNSLYSSGWLMGDCRRCYLANIEVETITGPATELVTNGTFNIDTSSWAASNNSTLSFNAGVMRITMSATADGGATQTISGLVIGKAYKFSMTLNMGTLAYFTPLSSFGSLVVSAGFTQTGGYYQYSFTAAATSGVLTLRASNINSTGQYAEVDNVSIKEAVVDRTYKANGLTIFGSLTKALSATGNQVVAYSGWTADATFSNQLVTNGTFNTDVSGWTASGGGVLTLVSNAMQIANDGTGTNAARTSSPITCIVGRTYSFSATVVGGTGSPDITVSSVSGSLGNLTRIGYNNNASVVTFTFVAAATALYVVGGTTVLTANATAIFDNISVKSADIVGTNANLLQEAAWSSDLEVGTSDFYMGAWIKMLYGSDLSNNVYYPEQFDQSQWAKTNTTITANATTAPDGTTTADKLIESAVSGTHIVVQQFVGFITATASVYLKAAERTFATLYLSGSGIRAAMRVDLSAGTVTTSVASTTITTATAAAVGSGWYRVILSANGGSTLLTSMSISTELDGVIDLITSPADTYTGDGTSGIYVWGAKFNGGLTAGTYTPGQINLINILTPIVDRSFSSGNYYTLGIDGYGYLVATIFDGITTRTVNTGGTTLYMLTNNWHRVFMHYSAGRLTLNINGFDAFTTIGAPMLTLSGQYNLATYSEQFDNAIWTKTGGSITANTTAAPDSTTTADTFTEDTATSLHRFTQVVTALPGITYTASIYLIAGTRRYVTVYAFFGTSGFYCVVDTVGWTITQTGSAVTGVYASSTIALAATGIYRITLTGTIPSATTISLGVEGSLTSTPGAIGVSYLGASLTIIAWGAQIESGTVKPYQRVTNVPETILPLLTVGNNFSATAPFTGSIALVKFGVGIPSAEQSLFMYEQEKDMFADGFQVVMPSSTSVLDLTYDPDQDKYIVVQAGFESSYTGLVRTSSNLVPAGSYTKGSARSGVKLLSRSTTNIGVDLTMPQYNLREEIRKKAEASGLLQKNLVPFNFDTISFTANTSLLVTRNQLLSVASVVGTPYIGMGITGTGISANTFIKSINGTTYVLNNDVTATGTTVTMSQSYFTLPLGYTAVKVSSGTPGVKKREGSSKDYQRLFDGFKETIAFNVSPGSAVWVQILAKNTLGS